MIQRAAAACAASCARALRWLGGVAADRLVASLCALLPAARVALRLRVALNASVVAAQSMRPRFEKKPAPARVEKKPDLFVEKKFTAR